MSAARARTGALKTRRTSTHRGSCPASVARFRPTTRLAVLKRARRLGGRIRRRIKPDTEAVWQFLRRQPGLTGFVLMVRCGFTMSDYHSAFERGGIPDQAPIGLLRLCAPTAVAADPGYETLAPSAPSREELVRFFTEQRDRFERSEAARAFRDGLRPKGGGISSGEAELRWRLEKPRSGQRSDAGHCRTTDIISISTPGAKGLTGL